MARLEVSGSEVVVRLSAPEKLGAFHGNVRVPRQAVKEVRVAASPWREVRGLRAPGTAFPGLIALGTFRGRGWKDFVAIYRKRRGVVLELGENASGFRRIVLSDDSPEETVARLQA
ncbi:MAG: hypothetical protein M3144_09265 [Actinomycetota bacterium]|nr:hypothetical protein [Actinomycetota bacterium]